MLDEILARIKFNFLCCFAVDGSWSMKDSYLCGSINPFGGFWYNGKQYYKRYCDIPNE